MITINGVNVEEGNYLVVNHCRGYGVMYGEIISIEENYVRLKKDDGKFTPKFCLDDCEILRFGK